MAKLKLTPDFSHRLMMFRPIWLRRFKRRHRWLFRIAIAVPLLLAAAFILITHSPLTRQLIIPKIEKALNLKVDADSVYITRSGRVILTGARFTLPTIPGPAGRFLRVGKVTANVDWGSALKGDVKFRSIDFVEPVLTVSQSLVDRSLNLGALDLPASSGKTALPALTVMNAAVELGEHTATSYKALKHIVANGSFGPVPGDTSGAYRFVLQETGTRVRQPGGPPEPGFRITGLLKEDGTLETAVENFSLGDWRAESMPAAVRERLAELDLTGDIPRATFSYSPPGKMRAELTLRSVSMNVPNLSGTDVSTGPTDPQAIGPPSPSMRMHEVGGSIIFDQDLVLAVVHGMLVDVPYRVRLAYEGTSADAPFTCEVESTGFRVEQNPAIVPYLPRIVADILKIFSSPTAVANTKVSVRRGPPVNGQAADITFSGEVHLADGVAAFEVFPYQFKDMTATIRFNQDRVDIAEVTGRSDSGALLAATGWVAPLDDRAETLVDVQVTDAPIDAKMEEAFGPGRAGIVTALFNRAKYDELVGRQLVRPPSPEQDELDWTELASLERLLPTQRGEDAVATRDRIAALTAHLSVPVFEFRGNVNVGVRTHSPLGRGTGWRTQVDIEFPHVGMVPEVFPFPVVAEEVLVSISDQSGRMLRGDFHGLTGGEATVEALFTVPDADSVDQDPHPVVDIAAQGVPFTEQLIHALPGPDEPLMGEDEGAGRSELKSILRRMKLKGQGDADVHIAGREGKPGRMGFDVDARFTEARAEPRRSPDSPPVILTGIAGHVIASEERCTVDVSGRPAFDDLVHAPDAISAPMSVQADATFTSVEGVRRTDLTVNARTPSVALESPVQELVAPFSDAGARVLDDIRRIYRPQGRIDTEVRVTGSGSSVEVVLTNPRDVAADVMGGRIAMPWSMGSATVAPGQGVVRLEGVRGPVAFQGEWCGEVHADGAAPLGGDLPAPACALVAGVRDGSFEAPAIFRLLEDRLGRDAALAYGSYHARGKFDAQCRVDFRPGAPAELRGSLRPHSLTAVFPGGTATFPHVTGEIAIDRTGGVIRDVRAEADGWSVALDGNWQKTGAGYGLNLRLGGWGERLTDELRAVLPVPVGDAMRSLNTVVDGRFELENGVLTVTSGEGGASTSFEGDLRFDGLSLDVGVPLTQAEGRLHASFNGPPGDAPPRFSVDAWADSFSVAGIYVRDGRVLVRSGDTRGLVTIPGATGDCYGGKIAVHADLFPSSEAPDAPRRVEADVRLAGVRFAPLLDALTTRPGMEGPPGPDEQRDNDDSRGVLDAEATLDLLAGRPDTRRGRGLIRVSGGRIISLPLIVRMVEVSNFQLPSNSRLDFARANFYFRGPDMVFDEVSILSKQVEIVGAGIISGPAMALDFFFNSRSARPIPVLSWIIQGIRDELVTTRVSGVLSDPVVSLQQFPGPRRMLDRALGIDTAEGASAEFDRKSDAAEARSRRSFPGIQPTPDKPAVKVPSSPGPAPQP